MDNNDALAKAQVLAAVRKADAIVGIGDAYGWQRPQAYVDALAMLNACREAERATPALPPAPGKPKDIQKWVDATVEIRQREIGRREITAELVLAWERRTAEAGFSVGADYTARLIAVFDELVETFDAHAEAPRQLTGYESPEERESHSAALRVAGQLSVALGQRAQIADAANEAGASAPIWSGWSSHRTPTPRGTKSRMRSQRSSRARRRAWPNGIPCAPSG
jgi:hypothetical protein